MKLHLVIIMRKNHTYPDCVIVHIRGWLHKWTMVRLAKLKSATLPFVSTRMKSLRLQSLTLTHWAQGQDCEWGPLLCLKLAEQALKKLNIFRGKFYKRDFFHLLITGKQYSHFKEISALIIIISLLLRSTTSKYSLYQIHTYEESVSAPILSNSPLEVSNRPSPGQ